MNIGTHNKLSGQFGEGTAASFLKKNGYKILKRNYRNQIGEIDIVAQKGEDLVFVEVKTRSSAAFGTPSEAVTYYKKRKLVNTAKLYLLKNPTDMNVRFDVIEVYGRLVNGVFEVDEINHIEQVFWEV